ncbi:hypothetical protein D8834_05230 [Streptococcus oralis]|nr:hypothetical protein D8834_05230 [Streptococcus oralis]
MHTVALKGDPIFDWTNDSKDSSQVKFPIRCSCKIGVAQEIVHAVCINLTRNELHDLLVRIGMVDNTGYLFWEIWRHLKQDLVNLCLRTLDDFLGNSFMICIKEMFKSMGVGTMPKVMKERSGHGQERLSRIPFFRIFFFKNLCDTSCNLIDPQTVGKATVLPTMKGIAGSS